MHQLPFFPTYVVTLLVVSYMKCYLEVLVRSAISYSFKNQKAYFPGYCIINIHYFSILVLKEKTSLNFSHKNYKQCLSSIVQYPASFIAVLSFLFCWSDTHSTDFLTWSSCSRSANCALPTDHSVHVHLMSVIE